MPPSQLRCPLALALALALAGQAPANAQQVVADGDERTPAPGEYHTVDPVHPGDPAGYAFLAINAGTIVPTGEVTLRTEGMYAAAARARAQGAGSQIALQQGSVLTAGYSAAGLSAANGGEIHAVGTRIQTLGTAAHGAEAIDGSVVLEGVHISTQASLSHGVSVQNGSARVTDSLIEVNASQSNGLDVRGGSLQAERVRIDVGSSGYGVSMQNNGDAHLRSVQINGLGAGATGVLAGFGRLVLEEVDIDLTHERSGAGMQIVGEVEMRGGSIHARGGNASVVSFAASGGGKLLLDGVDMSGYHGISMAAGSELAMYNSRLDTNTIGININKRGGIVKLVGSSITTRNGVGILMLDKGELDVENSIVTADGEFWQAVSIMDGTARIQSSQLRTLGKNGRQLL